VKIKRVYQDARILIQDPRGNNLWLIAVGCELSGMRKVAAGFKGHFRNSKGVEEQQVGLSNIRSDLN
jgi:hypothetical protein